MIEVEIFFRPTYSALSSIPFPHLKFHPSWNDPTWFWLCWDRNRKVFFAFDCDKLEFEYLPTIAWLLPSIYQMEYPIVRPNSLLDFFINSNSFRFSLTILVLPGSTIEQTILC